MIIDEAQQPDNERDWRACQPPSIYDILTQLISEYNFTHSLSVNKNGEGYVVSAYNETKLLTIRASGEKYQYCCFSNRRTFDNEHSCNPFETGEIQGLNELESLVNWLFNPEYPPSPLADALTAMVGVDFPHDLRGKESIYTIDDLKDKESTLRWINLFSGERWVSSGWISAEVLLRAAEQVVKEAIATGNIPNKDV